MYIVKLPDGYNPDTPYKLIFTMHALGGSAEQIANGGMGTPSYYGLPPLANNTAIFVSPNGQTAGSVGGFSGWGNTGGEDVDFVEKMIQEVEAGLCIDQEKRFSTGFSYGGAISFAMACALPDKFRAVGIMSSGPISGCEGGTKPVAYYHQHGTNDPALYISMGRQMRDRFIRNNACTPRATEPMPNGQTPTRVDYDCDPDYPLSWVVFNGGHTPAATYPGETEPFGPRNVWEFFSQWD